MKNKARWIWVLPVVLGFALLWGILGSGGAPVSVAGDREIYKNLKTFSEILDIIEKNYVEEVNPGKALEGAIQGMIRSLDPHSVYLTPEMYRELQVDTKGVFGGLGIEITMKNDILTVVSPIEGTPAFLAGIKSDDQIIAIDGTPTQGMNIMEAVRKLRGPKGSKVTISILREGFDKPRDYTVTRDVIKIRSVRYESMEENIWYLRISSFNENTLDEIVKARNELVKENGSPKGLVLDLRSNPGGLLDQAVYVSDMFLKEGKIVSTKGRIPSSEKVYEARDDGNEVSCPMVVLINRGSASASEIVAGALRDNGRALLVGTQTFGKGSVQAIIPLNDGSAIKLTTAKYYTPKGTSIQATGIDPDVVVEFEKREGNGEEKKDRIIREKDLEGHLVGEEVKKESEAAETKPRDNQLQYALDLLKSWQVFGKMSPR
jgi:carboxyl-terminal processing protease